MLTVNSMFLLDGALTITATIGMILEFLGSLPLIIRHQAGSCYQNAWGEGGGFLWPVMGSSAEPKSKGIDAWVGYVGWFMSPAFMVAGLDCGLDELSEGCLVSLRSSATVKLLGCKDASMHFILGSMINALRKQRPSQQVLLGIYEKRKGLGGEGRSIGGVPSLITLKDWLPFVWLHVAVLAATLQPHLHFISISLQPHFINICSIVCCTLLLPCFGAALPSFHFAATCAAFFPFAASCATLTPQLQHSSLVLKLRIT
ncbi:hypothetical protein SLEP1_g53244 [Rubroshorea leprosula]|uniref:Uncharacterized protein n=1 Tax=Rubroshorea leprosula TaxID=152421 RepID=A0AAV5M9P9_9ROSI|nr:hypothetical protein SLEP1_g53244 [Rubroshorea leprosula]